MKRINKLYALSFSLLLTGVAYNADMATTILGPPTAEIRVTPSWTAQEQAIGEELVNAAHEGNRARTEEILTQNPLLVNFQNTKGETALMRAAYRGHTEIVQVLLDAHADTSLTDSIGYTALKLAHCWKHEAVIELLTNHVSIEPEEETLMVKPAVD